MPAKPPTSDDPSLAYETHARSVADDAFWEQVKRTSGGKPVPDDQIDLIVQQCQSLLGVRETDRFVDLCCGNGALTARIFGGAAGGVGVDCAPTLIGVAQRHFSWPGVRYELSDVVAWSDRPTEEADLALIYGSISYLPRERLAQLLAALRKHRRLRRLVIGNVPDRDRMDRFFTPDRYKPGDEDDPGSAVGICWSQDELARAADRAGWSIAIHQMPPTFYAAAYRFDAVLEPAGSHDER